MMYGGMNRSNEVEVGMVEVEVTTSEATETESSRVADLEARLLKLEEEKNELVRKLMKKTNDDDEEETKPDEFCWFELMPTHVMDTIFSHLSARDIPACRKVCVEWKSLIPPVSRYRYVNPTELAVKIVADGPIRYIHAAEYFRHSGVAVIVEQPCSIFVSMFKTQRLITYREEAASIDVKWIQWNPYGRVYPYTSSFWYVDDVTFNESLRIVWKSFTFPEKSPFTLPRAATNVRMISFDTVVWLDENGTLHKCALGGNTSVLMGYFFSDFEVYPGWDGIIEARDRRTGNFTVANVEKDPIEIISADSASPLPTFPLPTNYRDGPKVLEAVDPRTGNIARVGVNSAGIPRRDRLWEWPVSWNLMGRTSHFVLGNTAYILRRHRTLTAEGCRVPKVFNICAPKREKNVGLICTPAHPHQV
jgi:hypothetical protein